MMLFANKEFKGLFYVIAAVLLSFILLQQMVIKLMAEDFKQQMIEHDYEVAGYFYGQGWERSQVISGFTSEKSKEDQRTGQELLQAAGYSAGIHSTLLPRAENFYNRYAKGLLALSAVFLLTVLAPLMFFARRQDRRIEQAIGDIRNFMAGQVTIRLKDDEEDRLSHLFSSINRMAATQTSYIEKEKQGKEFLRDVISDISHQLKTPLAALRMYTEIIQNEKTGNEVINNFTFKSERELLRMETLLQNLLKLARLDAGAIELEKKPHTLKDFLEEVLQGYRTRAAREDKALTLNCHESLTMNFDAPWLLEAVGNIIKNALDHTAAGDRIDISAHETPVITEIVIQDNGTGIHPEDIHHIFKRFYRSRFSKDRQGIGIGLTLAKTIVERHGGSVTVESELGEKTVFHLVFPKLTNL